MCMRVESERITCPEAAASGRPCVARKEIGGNNDQAGFGRDCASSDSQANAAVTEVAMKNSTTGDGTASPDLRRPRRHRLASVRHHSAEASVSGTGCDHWTTRKGAAMKTKVGGLLAAGWELCCFWPARCRCQLSRRRPV